MDVGLQMEMPEGTEAVLEPDGRCVLLRRRTRWRRRTGLWGRVRRCVHSRAARKWLVGAAAAPSYCERHGPTLSAARPGAVARAESAMHSEMAFVSDGCLLARGCWAGGSDAAVFAPTVLAVTGVETPAGGHPAEN